MEFDTVQFEINIYGDDGTWFQFSFVLVGSDGISVAVTDVGDVNG